MAEFQEVELRNDDGVERTATSPAQLAQFTYDGFYVADEAQVAAAKAAEEQVAAAKAAEEQAAAAAAAEERAKVEAAEEPAKVEAPKALGRARSGQSAEGEKTVGSNPS